MSLQNYKKFFNYPQKLINYLVPMALQVVYSGRRA